MSGNEELDAARDYWQQIFERLSADPMATLIERDRAIAELETNSHESILDAYGLPPEMVADAKEKYIEKVRNAPVTSPGVDPHVEAIFADLCRRVEDACKKVPALPARNVVRGIVPKLGVFASRMGVIMTDASIVTVGSQVFRFCNLVSKAVTRTMMVSPDGWDDIDDTSSMQKLVGARADVLSYWFQIVASFCIVGTSTSVPLWIPPPSQSHLRLEILESVEIFAVAHEYAHHILRHGRLQVASNDSGKDEAARQEEFEADSLAIAIGQLVTGHEPRENFLMLSGVGMVVLLHTLQMLDDARRILGLTPDGVAVAGTHPSAADIGGGPIRKIGPVYNVVVEAPEFTVHGGASNLACIGGAADRLDEEAVRKGGERPSTMRPYPINVFVLLRASAKNEAENGADRCRTRYRHDRSREPD
jgi:hypothetical protein